MKSGPSFFAELQRRHVYKVGAMYAVAGWLLVQVATQVLPFFHIDEAVVRWVVVAVVAGFPVALVLAWVFDLTPDGLVRTADASADSEAASAAAAPAAGRHQRSIERRLNIVLALLLVLALGYFMAERSLFKAPAASDTADAGNHAPGNAAAAADKRSIAVLPFENLSEDKANSYFATGMQDEVLTRLAKIGALKVISRTSTAQYAAAPTNLREIARELGVANILEGSVQKVGTRVRINVQLIEAATDAHLWAEIYDRELTDLFGVESEVATMIATTLNARLTEGEARVLASKPTDNPAAYDAYLRGLAGEAAGFSMAHQQQSIADFRQAVALDPNFALAWAHLSINEGWLYQDGLDHTEKRRAAAEAAAKTAMRLRPDLGESHLAQGYFHYSVEADYDASLRSFEEAARLLPNNADALRAISVAKRRKGQWEEAASLQRRAVELDPRNLKLLSDLAYTLDRLGRAEESAQLVERALLLAPGDAGWLTRKAGALFVAGDLEAALRLIDSIPGPQSQLEARGLRNVLLLFQRRYPEAIADSRDVIAHPDPELLDIVGDYYSTLTLAQERSQDIAGMQASCRQGISRLEALRAQGSDTPGLQMNLAQLHAQLGERKAALAEIDKGLARVRGDALNEPRMRSVQAAVLMWLGDHDGALKALEQVHAEAPPGFLPATVLRLDPTWDPLRSEPRFQALIGTP